MKRVSILLAALATIAVAAPSVANAQGFSVRIGSDRDYYYRALPQPARRVLRT